MKKLITILLCAALVLCIAACGGPTEPTGTQAPTGPDNNQEPSFTSPYKGTENIEKTSGKHAPGSFFIITVF